MDAAAKDFGLGFIDIKRFISQSEISPLKLTVSTTNLQDDSNLSIDKACVLVFTGWPSMKMGWSGPGEFSLS